MMKSTPPPRWLIVGNSAIIIAISAALVGMVVGGISLGVTASAWDPCIMLGGLVMLPFPLAVGILQYVAAFRQNARAALFVAIIHWFACLLFLFALITNTCEAVIEVGHFSLKLITFVTTFFCISAYCSFCGWMNLRLRKNLTEGAEDAHFHSGFSGRFQFTLRELLGGAVIVSIIAAMAGYVIHDPSLQYQEHVALDDIPGNRFDLPEGASDICYCRGIRGRLAYEFTIDETGFMQWAKGMIEKYSDNANDFDKIKKRGPFFIHQYTFLMPSVNSTSSSNPPVSITQGYFYEWLKGDEGFALAYDSQTRRAYYLRY